MFTPPANLPSASDGDELPFDLRRLALGLAGRWRGILVGGAALGLALALVAWARAGDLYEARVGLVKRRAHNEILLDRNVVIEREEFSMSTVAGSVKTARVLEQVRADTDYPGNLAQLSRAIAVENPHQTELLLMRVQDGDPQRAAEVAQSLLVHFQRDHAVRALANAREAVRVLSERRETVSARLAGIEHERMGLLETHGFSDIEGERTALLKQRSFAEQERIGAREALGRARRAAARFGASLAKEPELVRFSETEELPLQRELARLEVALAGLLQRYTAEHPEVQDLEQQVTELRRRIESGQDHALRKVTQQLNPLRGQLLLQAAAAEVEVEVVAARAAALEELAVSVRARLELLRTVERRLQQLDREAEEARELLIAYRNGIESAEILMASEAQTFEVVEEPQVPSQPLPSKQRVYAAGALGAGFGLAFLLALGFELRDTRVRAAEELCELGLETVHVLPAPGQLADPSYALAAQVLFPTITPGRPPVLAGLTDDPTPDALAERFCAVGLPGPIAARQVAEIPLPSDWRDRSLWLVVPAGQVPRATIERYLRRARQLGAAPTAALFVAERSDAPFDTLSGPLPNALCTK